MFSSNLHTPLVYEKDFLIPIEGEKIPEEVQKEIRSSHSHFSSFRNVFFTEPAIRGRTKRCMCTPNHQRMDLQDPECWVRSGEDLACSDPKHPLPLSQSSHAEEELHRKHGETVKDLHAQPGGPAHWYDWENSESNHLTLAYSRVIFSSISFSLLISSK